MERTSARPERYEGAKWSHGQTMETTEWDGWVRKTRKIKTTKKDVAEKWEGERDAENVSVCREKNAHSWVYSSRNHHHVTSCSNAVFKSQQLIDSYTSTVHGSQWSWFMNGNNQSFIWEALTRWHSNTSSPPKTPWIKMPPSIAYIHHISMWAFFTASGFTFISYLYLELWILSKSIAQSLVMYCSATITSGSPSLLLFCAVCFLPLSPSSPPAQRNAESVNS